MFDGHQGEGMLDQEHKAMTVEFVGPGSKLYCNYHLGLNAQKCDACGQFLPDDALPPPHAEKALDDWTPYCDQLEFELANFLFTHAECLPKKLMHCWISGLHHCSNWVGNHHLRTTWTFTVSSTVPTLAMLGGGTSPFSTPAKSMAMILHPGCLTTMKSGIEIHTKSSIAFSQVPDLQRCWQDFMLGDWAWEQASCQDRILDDDPTTAGATLVPIILSSDKTTVSVATRQTDYYPLYLSIGNVPNTVHHAHHNTVVLIGFLAMPKSKPISFVLILLLMASSSN
ncbi:hypothetical protein EDD17DRAFT_1516295 [Pisolithus thermaeus]|nr:hypothetical protein EV401DRAFT_1896451 [Pisolithus croceorrhizus]KAI6140695.1 hypothetical protein EDD17DRAFT_1516295 [Pisolithus thermaeus]